MCGISGFLPFETRRQDEGTRCVRRMGRYLRHRGPDAWGEWSDGSIFLGHNRLSILDLGLGKQPMVASGRAAIVFNGEIYNFKDLWRELESRGCRFQTDHSDTEVVLNGYLEWGPGIFSRLEGMFALALWDVPSRCLHLVRDHAGIKPLYLARTAEGLVFASEPKAILASGLVEPKLRSEGVAEYFLFRAPLGPGTLLEGVEKIPPGAMTTVHASGRVEGPRSFRSSPAKSSPSEEEIEVALGRAVASHLVSDVPLGVFLSGGVDSSLVAFEAAKAARPETFTVSTDSPLDESPFAKAAAERCGLAWNVETVTGSDFLAGVDSWTYVNDDPSADPSALALLLLSRFARSRGMKVMLAGEGSDELFGGYNSYVRYEGLRSLGVLRRFIAPFSSGRNRDYLCQKNGSVYLGTGHLSDEPSHRAILNEPLHACVSELRRGRTPDPARTPLRQAMLFDQETRLADDVLMRTDRATMFYGLEARVPFLDRKVIDLANDLPDGDCIRVFPPETKRLLKRIALRHLPREIIVRPKRGFDLPVSDWLRRDFASEIDRFLLERRIPVLCYEGLSNLVAAFRATPSAFSSGLLWAWLVLERWHRVWTGALPDPLVPDLLRGLDGVEAFP